MISGVALLGGGGYLIFSGFRDIQDAKASPSWGVMVGKRNGIVYQKSW
ncbi:MAG: hypothetical protein LC791_12550 [Acidobacteria bacterium]|nr:hypothetical protein [Acidobacteriota bacterium]